MTDSYDLSKRCVVSLTGGPVASAQLAKAPWATVEQTYLSGRGTSLMGRTILLPHTHFFLSHVQTNVLPLLLLLVWALGPPDVRLLLASSSALASTVGCLDVY